ncbi:hypothetical protein D9M68_622880 [compost metagenome]
MRLLQAAQPRQQPQAGHADAGGDCDRPLALDAAYLGDHVLQLLQRAVGAAEQPFALGGEGDAAMLAHEQRHLQLLFQRVDLPADRRLRQAQVVRGLGDAHAPADGDEALEQVERKQPDERDRHVGGLLANTADRRAKPHYSTIREAFAMRGAHGKTTE